MSVAEEADGAGAAPADAAHPLVVRVVGPLSALPGEERRLLLDRSTSSDVGVRVRTGEVVGRVRRDGDAALRTLARELDGVELASLEVRRREWDGALARLDPSLRRVMERAIANVSAVHRAFLPRAQETSPEPGITIGRRPDPLGRVGVYAPGGRAAYPSSVIMGVVPARVAGVGEVIVCSPPRRDAGRPPDVVLAAAALTGADRVFALGGAGAVAAMAYGTATVPRVDRIVGPGNAYVAEAKLQVAGSVATDAPAGPSELLVVADATADPELVARELAAQAEHDPRACVAAVMAGEAAARAVGDALGRVVRTAPRADTVRRALAARGAVLWAESLDEALRFAGEYAPEHLLLCLADAALDGALGQVRNAGTVCVGERASVAFGDYLTGANHVLPTGGLARSYSGLSTLDFVRWTTYQRIEPAAAAALAADAATFADAEGLPGHAEAARGRAMAPAPADRGGRDGSGEPPQGGTIRAAPLARAEVRGLPRYVPDESACEIDVSDNTNLWGAPPAARRALAGAAAAPSRYPSPYSGVLAAALLDYVGVRDGAAGVVTGCGSDDVLDSALRAFAGPGESIAFSTPTFSMIPTFARLNGLKPRPVPLTGSFDADPERLLATGAKIIYLCSPNNPTATRVSRAAIERIVEAAPGLVIVDEAYAEFAGWSAVELVARSDRLLVTRTFSKAFGLAGLRVGYGVGHAAVTRMVERARGPYKVSVAAERAALAALGPGRHALGWVRRHAALACEVRERLSAELRGLGLAPLPSRANFVFVPVRGAAALGRRLRAHGVLVRTLAGLPTQLAPLAASGGQALRIGVGPWESMERLLDALRAEVAP